MPEKLKNEDVKVDAVLETTFWANPVKDSGFRYRATHLDGKRAPKVVLCDDPRIRPGLPCQVRVKVVRVDMNRRQLDFRVAGLSDDGEPPRGRVRRMPRGRRRRGEE